MSKLKISTSLKLEQIETERTQKRDQAQAEMIMKIQQRLAVTAQVDDASIAYRKSKQKKLNNTSKIPTKPERNSRPRKKIPEIVHHKGNLPAEHPKSGQQGSNITDRHSISTSTVKGLHKQFDASSVKQLPATTGYTEMPVRYLKSEQQDANISMRGQEIPTYTARRLCKRFDSSSVKRIPARSRYSNMSVEHPKLEGRDVKISMRGQGIPASATRRLCKRFQSCSLDADTSFRFRIDFHENNCQPHEATKGNHKLC